ncbi:ATP-binding protein [Arthrobacter sp. R3-55]|jgi:two-component system, NarL family, sensor histidine kinase UhpB|uniref:sensor histidine kinase n=1 Tax=Paenarthrobacter sp. CM16 TaxID=2738447 RepID=UPI0020A6B24B|nr:ATP-binding protein [Paenarthrobacter sp. CM16]
MKDNDVGDAMEHSSALSEVVAVKGIIQDQHPVDFYALGVAGCIDRLAAPLRRTGITVHWHTPHHGIEISSSAAALLYHVAQETFSNTLNYADASELTVRLNAVYHGIQLTITDDGTGFEIHAAPSGRRHGFGLLLMSIAVHDAGGTVDIDSAPGRGTSVRVTLPLD